MKIAMFLLPLLLLACTFSDSIEESLMDNYKDCKKGSEIELSSVEQKGPVKVKQTKDFIFSGWENDTCTMRYVFGSCNYTRAEVDNSNYSIFTELLMDRCFG